MTRYILTALEDGQKRTLTWLDGVLSGEESLQLRFQKVWDKTDQEAFRAAIPKDFDVKYWRNYLAEKILFELCEERLDFQHNLVSTPEELQKWADAWNSNRLGDDDEIYTAQDMKEIEEEDARRNHQGPPSSWQEIKQSLRRKDKPEHCLKSFICESAESRQQLERTQKLLNEPPKDTPKCLECLRDME